MKTDFRRYENGTGIYVCGPWQINVGARLMCPDGKVRRASYLAKAADTYFSIRAGVRIRGKYLRGWAGADRGTLRFNPFTNQ